MRQSQTEPGVLGKIFAALLGAVLLVLGFMFSVVLLAFVAVIGVVALGYFWWKTRALRKAMREHPVDGNSERPVIEGEAVVIEEYPASERVVLPHEPLPK